MKRLLLLALVVLWSIPQWAASAVLTTNGSSCPGTTNTTAIVVNLPEDKGGATLTVAGTWTGTISFYGTGSGGINGGGIWTALSVLPIGSSTAVTSTTANGTWQVNVAGFTGVCMLSSASMTGSATVTITPSAASARSNSGSSSGSGVTSVTCGAGLSGGTITTSGTCAVIAASGASNYPLCSAVSGGLPSSGICTFTISSANMLLMSAGTAYTFIAAQGSGLYTSVTKLELNYVVSACTKYTLSGASTIDVFIGTNDTSLGVNTAGFIDQTNSTSIELSSPGAAFGGAIAGTPGTATAITDYTNQAITLNNNGVNPWSVGTCTVKGTAEYSIVSLN